MKTIIIFKEEACESKLFLERAQHLAQQRRFAARAG
jgi:hypothetical protein